MKTIILVNAREHLKNGAVPKSQTSRTINFNINIMALIQNKGSYTVGIGICKKQKKPGDNWTEQVTIPNPTGVPLTSNIDPDLGSGKQSINEDDCRYINANKIGDYAFVHAIAHDDHVLTSAKIGPHTFWVFDGLNFIEREDLSQKDCKNCHGW